MFDITRPLIQLGIGDAWTIEDSFSGVQILGGTGSGKTSGSGATLARAFLLEDYGGLVLTVKPGECDQWKQWAKACNRSDNLYILRPHSPFYFNFLRATRSRYFELFSPMQRTTYVAR